MTHTLHDIFTNQIVLDGTTQELFSNVTLNPITRIRDDEKVTSYYFKGAIAYNVEDRVWVINRPSRPPKKQSQRSRKDERDESGWTLEKYMNNNDLIRMLARKKLEGEFNKPEEPSPNHTAAEVWNASLTSKLFLCIVQDGDAHIGYSPKNPTINYKVIRVDGEWQITNKE